MSKGRVGRVSCSGPCEGTGRFAMPGFWWCLGCWRVVPVNLGLWFDMCRRRGDGAGCARAKVVIDEHLALLRDVEVNP